MVHRSCFLDLARVRHGALMVHWTALIHNVVRYAV